MPLHPTPSNAEIGSALFIAETTVKTHINNAFAKIGDRNRTEAAVYARDKLL
ncbi:LuxR C-terminal-related transcriptional regulator [Microbispora sp. NPDC046973]|uniref:LuxR C-terminal-related transcriptional regulator n=1 Tax=Microbispora sp. NPDC046973 TaxID=3155022 RepID=UPI0033EBDA3E